VPESLLDTNVYLHALLRDRDSGECLAFLRALDEGRVQAVVDALVIHELSYGLSRILRLDRPTVAQHLRTLLRSSGVVADRQVLLPAVDLWAQAPGLGFVDAVLTVRARQEGRAVFTINRRELSRLGVTTPDPLPS
jgi:predicted nucleic acid-binding protein